MIDCLNHVESGSCSSSAPEPPKQSKGKGLAFDPLPKPKSKKPNLPARKTAPGLFDAFGGGFGAIPPDIADHDDLSAGFQRMMEELAQGDYHDNDHDA